MTQIIALIVLAAFLAGPALTIQEWVIFGAIAATLIAAMYLTGHPPQLPTVH